MSDYKFGLNRTIDDIKDQEDAILSTLNLLQRTDCYANNPEIEELISFLKGYKFALEEVRYSLQALVSREGGVEE